MIIDLGNSDYGEKIGTIGEFAYYLLSGNRIDFEYAALRSSYDAAIRGISSMIFVSESRFLHRKPPTALQEVINLTYLNIYSRLRVYFYSFNSIKLGFGKESRLIFQ